MVNNYYKRKHEIAKKRLDLRLEMLQSLFQTVSTLIEFNEPLKDQNFAKELEKVHLNSQLFGYQDEMDLFNLCINAINIQDYKQLKTTSMNLFLLILPRIRKELGLPKLKY